MPWTSAGCGNTTGFPAVVTLSYLPTHSPVFDERLELVIRAILAKLRDLEILAEVRLLWAL
jgi:hypothetical protein